MNNDKNQIESEININISNIKQHQKKTARCYYIISNSELLRLNPFLKRFYPLKLTNF